MGDEQAGISDELKSMALTGGEGEGDGEVTGLGLKLRELEKRKTELATCQLKIMGILLRWRGRWN